MSNFEIGDILFQDLGCGAVCDAINGVTPGYNNAEINHCGIVAVSGTTMVVIEAITPMVRITPIESFLKRAVDDHQRPRIMVGRTRPTISALIPKALEFCQMKIGKPYDPLFDASDAAFYCSELITDGFRFANAGASVFPEEPMNFRNIATGELLPFWKSYFDYFNAPVPEGKPGSNPGKLSLDMKISIIQQLGDMRGSTL